MTQLSLEQLESIRDESFADDIPITDIMRNWSEDRARAFFESGGKSEAVAEPPPPAAASSMVVSPRPGAQAFQRVKIFGDSHANTFITIESSGGAAPLIGYPFTAGSAMGLRHADSITGYREALEGDLYATRPTDLIVLKFGQVDCDFVYYLKLADKPGLDFAAFAADSVSKYFSFIDDALASLPVTRENLCIMTPFATCVPDAHLRDSLCTLPFMDAAFKRQFREKLNRMTLPSLQQRTAHGRTYAELLTAEATKRGLRCVNIHAPMLGRDGVNALLNDSQNHHLVDAHTPLLVPVLDEAFGGQHARARLPRTLPPPAYNASGPEVEGAAMMWLEMLQLMRQGQIPLKLAGHAVGSYRDIERRFGPPLPMQYAPPRAEEPGFANWFVRFPQPEPPASPPGTPAAAAAAKPAAGGIAMVRILGRYRNYDDDHAWLIECSTPLLVDAVRKVMEEPPAKMKGVSMASPSRRPPAFEVPPTSFMRVLSGKR